MHCIENYVYVFLFWELRGLSPNFHVHVSVIDLYIPRFCLHIAYSRIGRLIVRIYKSLTHTWMLKLGLWPCNSFSGNISILFICSVEQKIILIHVCVNTQKLPRSEFLPKLLFYTFSWFLNLTSCSFPLLFTRCVSKCNLTKQRSPNRPYKVREVWLLSNYEKHADR